MQKLYGIMVLACGLMLTACGTTPMAKFYTLGSIENTRQSVTPQKKIALRVNSFTFPDYLDRPNIVTRPSGNRVEVAEFHRWAGIFPDEFNRVLGANLGILSNSPFISVYPAETPFEPDYYLSGNIVSFDGTLDGEVKLDIYWAIKDKSRRNMLGIRHSIFTAKVQGKDYDALVDAYGRVLSDLSNEIYQVLLKEVKNQS